MTLKVLALWKRKAPRPQTTTCRQASPFLSRCPTSNKAPTTRLAPPCQMQHPWATRKRCSPPATSNKFRSRVPERRQCMWLVPASYFHLSPFSVLFNFSASRLCLHFLCFVMFRLASKELHTAWASADQIWRGVLNARRACKPAHDAMTQVPLLYFSFLVCLGQTVLPAGTRCALSALSRRASPSSC